MSEIDFFQGIPRKLVRSPPKLCKKKNADLGALGRPGSQELRAVKIPASYDAWRRSRRRKNDSETIQFVLVSEISFSSFTDHRHLRTIVQDARTQYRSNRNEYRIDRIEKTQNATFEGIKPYVPGYFRIVRIEFRFEGISGRSA